MATKFQTINDPIRALGAASKAFAAAIATIKGTLPEPFPKTAAHNIEVVIVEDSAPPKRGCLPRAYAEIVINMAGRHEARDLMVMKMTHHLIPGYAFSNIRATRELRTMGRHKIVARIENAG